MPEEKKLPEMLPEWDRLKMIAENSFTEAAVSRALQWAVLMEEEMKVAKRRPMAEVISSSLGRMEQPFEEGSWAHVQAVFILTFGWMYGLKLVRHYNRSNK
jgi:hypothetical protein